MSEFRKPGQEEVMGFTSISGDHTVSVSSDIGVNGFPNEELSAGEDIPLFIGEVATADLRQQVVNAYNQLVAFQKEQDESTSPAQVDSGTTPRRRREDVVRGIEGQFGGADVATVLDVLYQEQGLSTYEIAAITGVNHTTIYNLLLASGVTLRSRLDGQIKRYEQGGKKSKAQKDAERRLGESIEEVLKRLYIGERLGSGTIAKRIGVSHGTIQGWLRLFNIPVRSEEWGNLTEEAEKRRIAGMRQAWAERKDEIVAKIHTGNSDEIRVRSRTAYYASNPQELNRVRQSWAAGKARSLQVRQSKVFGKDIAKALSRMHYFECMTIGEISELTGYSDFYIETLMKEYGIQNITPRKQWLEKMFEIQDLLPYIWAHPEIMDVLSKNQRYVLERRFLIEDPERSEITQVELAQEMGLTRQRVEQLETKAIEKLTALVRSRAT